jgi:hypothetical protein
LGWGENRVGNVASHSGLVRTPPVSSHPLWNSNAIRICLVSNQLLNIPDLVYDSSGHARRHFQTLMGSAEIGEMREEMRGQTDKKYGRNTGTDGTDPDFYREKPAEVRDTLAENRGEWGSLFRGDPIEVKDQGGMGQPAHFIQ